MALPSPIDRFTAAPSARGAAIVTYSGLPLVVTTDPLGFLLAYQGQSADYATTHGGYAVREAPADATPGTVAANAWGADLRGAHAFVTIANRRGYGLDGLAVRLACEVRDLADRLHGEPDYVAVSDVLEPLAGTAIGALSFVSGDLDAIRGWLDGALRDLAVYGGARRDAADAL